MNANELSEVLALHAKWLIGDKEGQRADLRYANLSSANLSYADLSSADLRDADLRSANLRYANLSYANLRSANLRDANLRSADLRDANLRDADLRAANLRSADLRSADLSYADLSSADLRDADLSYASLSDDLLWEQYLSDVVPALLTAGGKTLAEVATPEIWACHSWRSGEIACPIGTAFDCSELSSVPALYRDQAERFIQFFDVGLIPLPDATDQTPTATREEGK